MYISSWVKYRMLSTFAAMEAVMTTTLCHGLRQSWFPDSWFLVTGTLITFTRSSIGPSIPPSQRRWVLVTLAGWVVWVLLVLTFTRSSIGPSIPLDTETLGAGYTGGVVCVGIVSTYIHKVLHWALYTPRHGDTGSWLHWRCGLCGYC